MKKTYLLVVGALLGLGWSSNANAMDTVEDYMEVANAHLSSNGSRYIGYTSSNDYVIVGNALHNGVQGNWVCRSRCTNFDGDTCRSGSSGSWSSLDPAVPLRISGGGGNDTMVGVPWPNFHPGGVCHSDEGGSQADTWDPPTIGFLSMRGGGGNDNIIGPPGDIWTVLYGGSGDDYIETASTDSRSFAFGGDYWCSANTCYPSTTASADGNDSLLGTGRNWTGTSTFYSGDNLFGGMGNDCLRDMNSGANRFSCGGGSDEYVPPSSGGSAPLSCEQVVSDCWNPFVP